MLLSFFFLLKLNGSSSLTRMYLLVSTSNVFLPNIFLYFTWVDIDHEHSLTSKKGE